MSKNDDNISKVFSKRKRLRLCGILIEDERILLIKHKGIGELGEFWSPPGGEANFSEPIHKAIKREFFEETGLLVEVEEFLFLTEYIKQGLHAVEMFFNVKRIGGKLQMGFEPELDENIIVDLKFLSWEDINQIENEKLHRLFQEIGNLNEIKELKGFLN